MEKNHNQAIEFNFEISDSDRSVQNYTSTAQPNTNGRKRYCRRQNTTSI